MEKSRRTSCMKVHLSVMNPLAISDIKQPWQCKVQHRLWSAESKHRLRWRLAHISAKTAGTEMMFCRIYGHKSHIGRKREWNPNGWVRMCTISAQPPCWYLIYCPRVGSRLGETTVYPVNTISNSPATYNTSQLTCGILREKCKVYQLDTGRVIFSSLCTIVGLWRRKKARLYRSLILVIISDLKLHHRVLLVTFLSRQWRLGLTATRQ